MGVPVSHAELSDPQRKFVARWERERVQRKIHPSTHLRSRLQGHLVADAHNVQLLGQCMDTNAELTNICPIQAIDAVRAENALLLHRHHGEALAPRWWQ